jgi:hypothetical protein
VTTEAGGVVTLQLIYLLALERTTVLQRQMIWAARCAVLSLAIKYVRYVCIFCKMCTDVAEMRARTTIE